jgi:GT2 family glycosyltransferase
MLLTVCIVNWNTREFLAECLTSLYAYPPIGCDMQVIVVDNGSADESVSMMAERFPEVCLIASDTNLGYAEGNNVALKRAEGDFVLLLNPDVIVHEQSLSNAIDFLKGRRDAAAVGVRLVGKDGKTQSSLRGFPDPLPVFFEYAGLARLFPKSRRFGQYRMTYFDYDQSGEVDQPMGSFLMLSRAALDQVGMMDPDFPIFFNEVDWCWRAKRDLGWKIYYTPTAEVTHVGGASTRQVKARMISESHGSLLRFYEKHYKKRLKGPLYAAITRAVMWHERRALKAAAT